MKVDYEYIKEILILFEGSGVPYPMLSSLVENEYEVEKEFAFHMNILFDQGFIEYMNYDANESPFMPNNHHPDGFDWADTNARLTAQGHDFLAALKKKEIMSAIIDQLKEDSIDTIWKVTKNITTKIATEKLEKYLNLEN